MSFLALLLSLGSVPETQLTVRPTPRVESGVALSSVPQLGLLNAEGTMGLGRAAVELGGWNLFLTNTTGFLRGGWAGAKMIAFETDAVGIEGEVRAFVAQPSSTSAIVAGLGGAARSRIAVFSWLALRPDFDVEVLGPLVTARLANELELRAGDWRVGLLGGGQAWAKDGPVVAAFGAALSVGWRHEFGTTALEITGAMAVAKDPSFLLKQPVLQAPREDYGLWAAVRVAVSTPEGPKL